jgi:hypothetical protein
MRAHAILIPCQLRSVDENFFAFLDSCIEKAMIFIVTERSHAEDAHIFFERYGADIAFIEEASESEMGVSCKDALLMHPEFVKLEVALNRLVSWEMINEHRFDYIHRFRPDVIYSKSFEDFISPLTCLASAEDHLLMSWSVIYSGRRDAMLKLLGHTKFQVEYKTSLKAFAEISTQINVDALRRSSNAWPYLSCFPVGILNSDDAISSFHEKIQIEYPSYIDAAESFIKRLRLESIPQVLYDAAFSANISLVRCYYRRWQGAIPEHVFFFYLNSLGLSAGYYGADSPLKYSRHATTSFTARIFDCIQAKDYSFLDANYQWEKELDNFVQAGGKVPFAIQKISYIDIEMLSDQSCKSLYRIIDMLDCSEWLFDYSESFVKSVVQRGIEPPQSFRAHL